MKASGLHMYGLNMAGYIVLFRRGFSTNIANPTEVRGSVHLFQNQIV